MDTLVRYNDYMFSDIIILALCAIPVLAFIFATIDLVAHDDFSDLYDDEVAR